MRLLKEDATINAVSARLMATRRARVTLPPFPSHDVGACHPWSGGGEDGLLQSHKKQVMQSRSRGGVEAATDDDMGSVW